MPDFPGGVAKPDCGWRRFRDVVEIEARLSAFPLPRAMRRMVTAPRSSNSIMVSSPRTTMSELPATSPADSLLEGQRVLVVVRGVDAFWILAVGGQMQLQGVGHAVLQQREVGEL